MSTITKRYDFVFLFDVQDGNPNGDPDAGNLPRIDAETGMGLVTDVCLKRKIRNFVQLTQVEGENKESTPKKGYDIFVKERAILNKSIDLGYKSAGLDPEQAKKSEEKKDKSQKRRDEIKSVRDKMCEIFYDIRTFGSVLSTGANAGQVRGPAQMTFARSIDPVVALEHSITRMAVTSEGDAEKKETEMGRKFTIPYGLYRSHGFISAHLANQTGFSDDDLKLFWDSILNAFEHDRSAARGLMSTRGLLVFEHGTALGNAAAHSLFERIQIKRKQGSTGPARSFGDYEIIIDEKGLPEGVKLIRMA